jgi:glycosyltransferase involved in cell wall biosynthesis
MHIALLSPLFESVPPKLYGGTERVVANLCRGFAELGHDVTLFASGDSAASRDALLVASVDRALRLANVGAAEQVSYHVAQLGDVIRRMDAFDVVHNHNDLFGLPLALLDRAPVVTTLHGRLDGREARHLLQAYADTPFVSISGSQRLPLPDLNWVGTVYHGLPLADFKFAPEPGRYLAFLGRVSPEKRPDLAIEIARLSGVPLKIAAKVDHHDRDYYESVVKPLIDGKHVEFIGEIGEHEKSEFLGGALGLLFPIDWPEPFGLAPVEAWACGTPVLARPRGSVVELHADGVSGFVREDVHQLARLVPELFTFDRARCRAYAETNFSLHRMCEDYLDVYRHLDDAQSRQEALQSGQSDGGGWGVLHPLRRAAAGHRQAGLEG